MTTLAGARAALIAAVDAVDLAATETPGTRVPPYVAVLGDGLALDRIVTGRVVGRFRLALVAGAADQSGAAAELDSMKLTILVALRALAGWQLGEVRPDGIRTYGGAEYLTCDVTASTLIDL